VNFNFFIFLPPFHFFEGHQYFKKYKIKNLLDNNKKKEGKKKMKKKFVIYDEDENIEEIEEDEKILKNELIERYKILSSNYDWENIDWGEIYDMNEDIKLLEEDI
jgi:hypothetical protein